MRTEPFKDRVWLSSPTMYGEELQFVHEAFDTNWVAPLGPNVDKFESEMCAYIGCKRAVAMTAGTHAIHMALKYAGLKPGEKVFCSDLTFAATVNPVSYEGGEQVLIDSEYDTWNMDPEALRLAFKKYPDTKYVVVANLYGTPAKLSEIRAICDKHGAVLIEDAAESLSATYQGKQTGTFGSYNVISFNGNKIITTSGGGMLLTDDDAAADRVKKWITQSREPFPWYQHEELGYNYRMSNVVAGIGRGQLLHLDEHRAKKEAIYKRYEEGFAGLPVSLNPYTEDSVPNFWLSCLIIDEGVSVSPSDILDKLAKLNVEGRPIWKPMHMQPVYEGRDFISAKGDVAADIFERGLCLPSDVKMTPEVQDEVIEIIRSCF